MVKIRIPPKNATFEQLKKMYDELLEEQEENNRKHKLMLDLTIPAGDSGQLLINYTSRKR